MHIRLGLIALSAALVMAAQSAQAGETGGQLGISLSILPGCEVSTRVDDGRYRILDRDCSGPASFRVYTGQEARLSATSRQSNATEPQLSDRTKVMIYW
ncbi:hypothetical protein [Stutzerimonas marianensis]